MFRRTIFVLFCMIFLVLFLLWRIDNPRAERVRMALADQILPSFEIGLRPVTWFARIVADFESYARVYEQNQELRRELQRMQGWREAALQLEQTNAQLRALNNVKLSPRLEGVVGEVLTDSGGPFSQSAMVNIGAQDGVEDGQAAMDGLGLVGRVAGVGQQTARIVFVTDSSSQLPVVIRPTGARALVEGNDTSLPFLQFFSEFDEVSPGYRIYTSGDGGVFPADLLVGQIAQTAEGELRVRLAADFDHMEFLRLLRENEAEVLEDPGSLVGIELLPDMEADE